MFRRTEASMSFPSDFLWGVSTSAYQIEGAVDEDGRGPSIWDTFCATPGAIANGDTGDVACDHYHRYRTDLDLMSELGVGAYRFSLAWPRIHPDGSGTPNERGLAFYDRLLDELCARGIAPVATLYHWDTPQPLEDAGGWMNRDTSQRFAEYAAIAGERFSDRVAMWIPLNEPVVMTMYGYAVGQYAPGKTLLFDALPTAHVQNLAHGLAATALRAAGARSVGCANNHSPVRPVADTTADRAAAAHLDAVLNGLFADPMLLGRYPEPLLEHLPAGYAEDLPLISVPLDFYGVNYYEPQDVCAPSEGNPLPFELQPIQGRPMTTNGSPVVPEGLTGLLTSLRERYGGALPPVHITENGCSYDGIHDTERIEYLRAHVDALSEAMAAGVDVRGYFVWSLIDNFEWAGGYQPRFGLVHVDYETQQRTPKDSFAWYRDLIGGAR
jgi:beta-glucosidase